MLYVLKATVIAIGGSNGKTTTKELMHAVLASGKKTFATQGNLNNHIGVPLTLLKLNGTHRTAVIEMGMSGLGEIGQLSRFTLPDVGVITNIGPVHLQFLGDTDTIAQAKGAVAPASTSGRIERIQDPQSPRRIKRRFGKDR